MHDMSLVLFTCFAQAAVGMVFLLALLPASADLMPVNSGSPRQCMFTPGGFPLALALTLFALGVLFSLLHLSDPFISFYSITNMATSWLSREILFMGLFGLSILVLFFVRSRVLAVVAAVLGIGLIYVMSQVYMSVPMPFWNRGATWWVFLCSSLVLGAVTLLLVQTLRNGYAPVLSGIVVIASGVRLVFGVLQVLGGVEVAADLKLVFLHLGATVLAIVMLFLAAQAGNAGQDSKERTRRAVLRYTCAATSLLWAAEICARVMFYQSSSFFTM